jgi:hypothetical protein
VDATEVIHAQLEIKACTAELYVNRIAVARLRPDTALVTSISVPQLLVPFDNEIELLVEPGTSPSRARTEYHEETLSGASAVARLVRFSGEVVTNVENGELLAEVQWKSQDGVRDAFPKAIARQASLGALAGRWSWQDAPPLVLDDALVDEARAVLSELGQALRRGSAAAFRELVAVPCSEALRAYPALTEEYVNATVEQDVEHYHRSPDPVLPLVRERHDFRLAAADRMLECIDKDWLPSLRLRDPSGAIVPYPVFLARLEGRLRVVR